MIRRLRVARVQVKLEFIIPPPHKLLNGEGPDRDRNSCIGIQLLPSRWALQTLLTWILAFVNPSSPAFTMLGAAGGGVPARNARISPP
jgi:hypothetical protein